MEAIKTVLSGYTNNPIGAVAGIAAGYMVAKKLGYHQSFTVVPFCVVFSILGVTAERYIKARKGIPTAAMTK